MNDAEIFRGTTLNDTDLFIVRGLHLRLIANELRRMDILKTPDSHEALHTIGKVLEEILATPLHDQKSCLSDESQSS